MPTEPSHIASLLLSFHRETLSDADRKELDAWVAASEENARLYQELTDPDQVEAGLRQIDRYDADGVRQRILARMPDAFQRRPLLKYLKKFGCRTGEGSLFVRPSPRP